MLWSAAGAPGWPAKVPGTMEMDGVVAWVDYEEVWTPQVGDIAIDRDGTEWGCRSVRQMRMGFGVRPHHYEARFVILDTQ